MENANAIKLDVKKEFSVPVARLYEAWLKEEDLKEWWHPMGNNLQQATTTPQQGAPVSYTFANSDGAHSFTIKGEYKEVTEGKKLVYTWNWDVPAATVGHSEFLLTVVFTENGNGSQLLVTQENFTEEESVQPHREGWEKALNDLHQYLSRN